jgi:hypothetical protein
VTGYKRPVPFPDCPSPERYDLPDAVIAVQEGRLPIPQHFGFHAVTNMREGCAACRLYLQHPHNGVAAFPY